MMHVTRFRVYPNIATERRLFSCFDGCTFVRNWCLENQTYKDSVLPKLKEEYPELKGVHSKVLQNVVQQIAHNLKALKALKQNGKRVGRLRKKRVHSMIYEQSGFSIKGDRLHLSKVGDMPIVITREIPGTIKQVIIKHNRTHKWFVSVISETPETPVPTTGTACVGIDLNVDNFSTDTEGVVFEHPQNVRKMEKRLRRAQKKLSRKKRGSNNRKRQRLLVARIHETVENRRDDFLHKWSRYYVNRYDSIALENLSIRDMVETPISGRNKSILDAAWGKARTFVQYKAENAGKHVRLVNPAYTTQDCFRCGARVPKLLSERVHRCPHCGYTIGRDLNAALNIRKRAFQIGWGTPESTLAEIGTATPALPVQVPVDEARISPL